jgi:hypothetical protein
MIHIIFININEATTKVKLQYISIIHKFYQHQLKVKHFMYTSKKTNNSQSSSITPTITYHFHALNKIKKNKAKK